MPNVAARQSVHETSEREVISQLFRYLYRISAAWFTDKPRGFGGRYENNSYFPCVYKIFFVPLYASYIYFNIWSSRTLLTSHCDIKHNNAAMLHTTLKTFKTFYNCSPQQAPHTILCTKMLKNFPFCALKRRKIFHFVH